MANDQNKKLKNRLGGVWNLEFWSLHVLRSFTRGKIYLLFVICILNFFLYPNRNRISNYKDIKTILFLPDYFLNP